MTASTPQTTIRALPFRPPTLRTGAESTRPTRPKPPPTRPSPPRTRLGFLGIGAKTCAVGSGTVVASGFGETTGAARDGAAAPSSCGAGFF